MSVSWNVWRQALAVLGGLIAWGASAEEFAPIVQPSVIARYPHDASLYTQGLLWHAGLLYESAGLYGRSSLSVRDLHTGKAVRSRPLAPAFFGEGLVWADGELIQLTWKEHRVFVYDPATLHLKRSVHYPWEGWGIADDGRHLVVSDGSNILRFLDRKTLAERRRIEVHDADVPIVLLNELEFVDGTIYANVYGEDRIAQIDPATGKVTAWLDFTTLYPPAQRSAPDAVLNGIAYDARRHVLLITGKYWPSMFAVALPRISAAKGEDRE